MKKQYFAVLSTLICVLGLGLGARAQGGEDTVLGKVPYDFVVRGQVLPAGTYRVSRIDTSSRTLEISSTEAGASAFLIPTFFDDTQTGHAQFSFEHVGNMYFLSAIETPIGTYSITVPQSAIELALMEQQSASSSGSN
ncbi:MAG: hypothetical protein WBV55_16155 [Candidatus Sulfotelmatobacter sp.]